jgi:hypothetical protein
MVTQRDRGPPVVIYVEGGAKGDLRQEARIALGRFLSQLQLNRQPAIRPMGARDEAFRAFIKRPRGEPAILLVDAEEVPGPGPRSPWRHVRKRDPSWTVSKHEDDRNLFFMCVVMETWCVADDEQVRATLGLPALSRSQRPVRPEEVPKRDVYKRLERLTDGRWTEKTGKALSFRLVGSLRPEKVRAGSPEFSAFIEELQRRCA